LSALMGMVYFSNRSEDWRLLKQRNKFDRDI